MGWVVTNKPKGQTIKDFFKTEMGEGVLDAAQVGFNEAYIAYKTQGGQVIGVACLIQYYKDPYYNFGYKEMSEDMGPYIYRCPERILRQLSPTSHPWALEWRQGCWANIEKRKRVPIKDGSFIKFSKPIRFTNGEVISLFQVEKIGRRIKFKKVYFSHNRLVASNYTHYIISNWRGRDFSLLTEEKAIEEAQKEANNELQYAQGQ